MTEHQNNLEMEYRVIICITSEFGTFLDMGRELHLGQTSSLLSGLWTVRSPIALALTLGTTLAVERQLARKISSCLVMHLQGRPVISRWRKVLMPPHSPLATHKSRGLTQFECIWYHAKCTIKLPGFGPDLKHCWYDGAFSDEIELRT